MGLKSKIFRAFLPAFMAALLSASPAPAQRLDPEVLAARRLAVDQGLFFALAQKDLTSLATLRDQGADPTVTLTELGLTPQALFGGSLEALSQAFIPDGWPILTWAVYLGDLDAAKILLRAGARVNAPDEYGATALHWAAWAGRTNAAHVLLDNGAACQAEDLKGRTPRDWAIMMGQAELIRLLDGKSCRPSPIADQDRDGVPDREDLCPGTPFGAPVDNRGCWLAAQPEFFDRDGQGVKSQFLPYLAETARILKNYPELKIELEGHTDAVGSAEYNQQLGLARAERVRDILVREGVEAGRVGVRSLGASKPVGAVGLTLGRRVEIKIISNNDTASK